MSQGARPTFQKRSEQTRDKLVGALERLLHKKSFEEMTVAEIAAEAGVSPGSIYRRFKNKEAFIPVLFELYLVRLEEWALRPEAQVEIEGCELKEGLKLVSNAVLAQLQHQKHILKAVYVYVRLRPDLMGDEWGQLEQQSYASFRAIIEHFKAEVKHTDLNKAARMITALFTSMFIEQGLFKDDAAPDEGALTNDELAEEVASMAYGYLTYGQS